MFKYKVLINEYVFDVESPTSIYPSNFMITTEVDGLNILKMTFSEATQPDPDNTYATLYHYFTRNILISNTIENRSIFKMILKTEIIRDILGIINFTLIDIYMIEDFNLLKYELKCKNDTLKRYFRYKINHNVPSDERKIAELENNITMEEIEKQFSDIFGWVNKDLQLFTIKNIHNIEDFDKLIAQKFEVPFYKAKIQRSKICMIMISPKHIRPRPDIIGKIITKEKYTKPSLKKIAKATLKQRASASKASTSISKASEASEDDSENDDELINGDDHSSDSDYEN